MKQISCVLAFVMLTGCGGAGAVTQFDGDSALGYVRQQLAFGPRVPNTPAHRQTGDWILAQLRRAADSTEVQAFDHVTTSGDTLRLRNFIGRFRPTEPARVVLLAHWDTRPRADQSANLGAQRTPIPGANDGASGVAVLLGVADVLARVPPSVGVDLVFVDGEDYGDFSGPDVLLGSRYYAATLDADRLPLYAVVFDMVGDADLEIPQEPNSVSAAPEVVNRVWSTARDLGYGRVFRDRMGGPITDDHIPLIQAGVRAIDLIDFSYGPGNAYWHTLEDTLDKVSAGSLKVVGDVAVALVQ
ncbi:MAG TPA: M28 family peptidase [Gemmatimonadales bacterium]